MRTGKYVILFFAILLATGCVEEFPITEEINVTVAIEEVLVVEGTLTDEFKEHRVYLTRGNRFSSADVPPNVVSSATVAVTDDAGNRYEFDERGPGEYVSTAPFAAQQNTAYTLNITTANGVSLQSDGVVLTGTSVIDALYAERTISDNGVEGMAIYVDSSNPQGNLNNYRYTYDETYKIIAPQWTSVEFEILAESGIQLNEDTGETEFILPDVQLVPRAEQEQVCFNTVASTAIILSDGIPLTSNEIGRNLVRFINRANPILSHRYSILVRQLLQTPEATEFYNTLLQFSENPDLFSAVQPGPIEGNVRAVNNTDTMVLGYFDVASVASARLFFDYTDFFPDEPLPPYFNMLNCDSFFAPILGNPERDGPIPPNVTCGEDLVSLIKREAVEYVLISSLGECQGPYFVVQRPCGDCTALGTNVVPDFWIE